MKTVATTTNWFRAAKMKAMPMPKRPLGKTGVEVGLVSMGGQGALEIDEDKAEMVRRAYDLGVNYFDTSPVYGPSEKIYGEALSDVRNGIFLATKSEQRDRDGALKDIEESLKRLKTDRLDLWQVHHLGSMDELDEVTGKGGAIEAFQEMKGQGVTRFVGVTGHEDPEVLLEAMKRFDFDTVLCPVNPADALMKPSFIDTVVREAQRRKMGVIGMKVFAQGYLFSRDGITTGWQLVNYSLSQPVSTIIVGCDAIEHVEENVSLAKSFYGLDDAQKKDIEDKVKGAEDGLKRGCFFRKEHGGYASKEKLKPPMYACHACKD
jgi:aryl-alcohol dehydrogenase-like predicted oxidoreductase